MDLLLSVGALLLLWLTNGDRARFYPLFMHQRNHRPVSTDDTPLQRLLTIRLDFRCLRGFHPAPDLLGESAYRLLVGLHRKKLFHHLGDFVEGHKASQVDQMFVLAWCEMAWQ